MKKQCSECPATFDTRDRSSTAKTCSAQCSQNRKRSVQRKYYQRPAVKLSNRERMRDYEKQPKYREWKREYRKQPKYRQAERERKRQPKYREANRKRGRARYHALGGDGYRRALPDLLSRDGYVCGICGQSLPQDHTQIDVDHRVPVAVAEQLGWSKEQINDLTNLQPAHPACNSRKWASWDGSLPGQPPVQMELFA